MSRSKHLKRLSPAPSLIALPIRTLYSQEAESLNFPAGDVPISNSLLLSKKVLKQKIRKLMLTSSQAHSVILSSTQVESSSNIFVMNKKISEVNGLGGDWVSEKYSDKNDFNVYINAKILQANKPIKAKQINISFPFMDAETNRYNELLIQFRGVNGERQRKNIKGFQAVVFQQGWDYSVGRHLMDWRLNLGQLSIQQNMRERLPKTQSILQQYQIEIKNMLRKYPQLRKMPESLQGDGLSWLDDRGLKEEISIEEDYLARIYKYYKKQMTLLLQRSQLNIL